MVQHLLREPGDNTNRLDVLLGPPGRRTWPGNMKGRTIAEAFEPGACVADVAPRTVGLNGKIRKLDPNHATRVRSSMRPAGLLQPRSARSRHLVQKSLCIRGVSGFVSPQSRSFQTSRSRVCRFAIDTAILHDCPDNAHCFIRHSDCRNIGRPAPTQLCKPDPGFAPPPHY